MPAALTSRRTAPPLGRLRRPALLVTGAMWAGIGAGWVSGCSVLYDLGAEQCSTDADCNALGGDFAGLACVDSLCQPRCESHADCIDSVGLGTEAYACIDRSCVALRTPECPTMLPQTRELWRENLRSSDPLILAGTGVITGSAPFDPLLRNYDLALTELTDKVIGIGSATRRLVMIGCQATFESNDQLDRMMSHLANDVRVPAMISALSADSLQRAFQDYGAAANMFFMSPLDSDPTLATLPDNGLIWHIGPGSDVIARAYGPLLTRTLDHLDVAGTVRVATVVASDERFLSNMVATITSSDFGIRFNGKSASQNLAEENYRGFTVTAEETDSSGVVTELLAFKPHVVISAGSNEFLDNIVDGIEAAIEAGAAADTPAPFYLLSPLNFNAPSVIEAITAHPDVRTRLAGVNGAAAENSANYERYLTAYQQAFGQLDRGFENYYDAAYYLIYSAAAVANSSPLTDGASLPTGMRRLLAGPEFNVGADQIPNALATLAVPNATIQLNGTLGPPDWNPLSGTRESPGSVWCVDADLEFQADVLRYEPGPAEDPGAATLSGTFPCIPGF